MEVKIEPLLNPKSVAIVGVSGNPRRIGGRLFKYLSKHGFEGDTFLVNPNYETINGVKCYPRISEIPAPVDCVLIAVSQKHVMPVLNECVDHHVKAAIIFSAGFAETGTEGKQAQKELKNIAKTKHIRICGPNCVGIINFTNKIALSFSQFLETDALIPGNIAFVSQSGALGGSLLNRAQDRKIGLSCFISTGNEADLELSDYINYLVLHDKKTKVIAALIEGFKDGSRFIESAKLALKHRKPIIALKIGETEIGGMAAASHTGALAGSDSVIDAVFRQENIMRVHNYDELLETASLFSKGRIPKGNRVGILTSTGGGGVIMADYFTKSGLKIPPPSKRTKEIASKEIPSFSQVANPFDLTAQLFNDPEMYQRCLKLFIEEDNFDIIQVNVSMVADQYSENRATHILKATKGSKKPIVSWWAAGKLSDPGIRALDGSEITLFKSPGRCATAVKSLVEYHQFLETHPCGKRHSIDIDEPIPFNKIKTIVDTEDTVLSEHQSKALLNLYGIPVTNEKVATSPDEAISFAEEIGYPVVLKIDSPDITHKTEANAVKLGVNSKGEIARNYEKILENVKEYDPKARVNGVLVQETVQGGTEVIVGVAEDVQFGQTIAFGLGGIFVDIMKDIALRVIPVSSLDAELMMKETKGYKVLSGSRGRKPADIEAVIGVLLNLSKLAENLKDYIFEIDINPLIVFDNGYGVKAVDALIVLKRPF